MWPAIAALIAGIIGAVGGHNANVQNENAAQRNAQTQMDFQREMSNTAHQREVADLRAAGLNPLLSGTGGMGASTPAGSALMPKITNIAEPAISSALQARRLSEEVKLMQAQTRNADTANDQIESQTNLNMRLQGKAVAEAELAANNARAVELQLPKARNLANVEGTVLGKYGAYADRILSTIGLGSKAITTRH